MNGSDRPSASLVVHNHPSEGGQQAHEALVLRMCPGMVEVRDEAWYVDQVEWAVADNLVGDRKVAAAGVLRLWRFHGVSDPRI